MSQEITLRSNLPETAKQELIAAGLPDFNVGDIYMIAAHHGYDRYAQLIRINKIVMSKGGKTIESIIYGRDNDWGGTEFSEHSSSKSSAESLAKLMIDEDWIKLTPQQVIEYRQKAKDLIDGKIDANDFADTDSDTLNSNTAVMGKASQHALQALTQELEVKRRTAELMGRFVTREMEQRKRALDEIKTKMYGVVAAFEKKIKTIMRVITTIELYLGIDEELFQIQEGTLAPADTPISFRQSLLYMDEEIGHWKDGGLDYTNIKWFDEWLIKDDNYKKCLPEEKGVVVFRPRRSDKDYQFGQDRAMDAALRNDANLNSTYLLIRNGDSLYRIFTEKIVILPRLFPKRADLEKMMAKMEAIMNDPEQWDNERKRDEVEAMQYEYRKRAVLLQGLIDRSEVFHPLPMEKVNIFKMDEMGDKVNFIYDDEALLPSGRLSFWDWHKLVNGLMKHGSRILLTGYYRDTFSWKYRDEEILNRMFNTDNRRRVPPLPNEGIYQVELHTSPENDWLKEDLYEKLKAAGDILNEYGTREDRMIKNWENDDDKRSGSKSSREYWKEYRCDYNQHYLTILYNPKDMVYGSWGNEKYDERKKRIRFKIFHDDEFILNYDGLSLDDINFYLENRTDRPNYIKMMPILIKVKEHLLAEMEKEMDFKKLIFGAVRPKLAKLDEVMIHARIERTLEWWKYKNQIKRPITEDDAKAYRMMVQRITSPNYANLKWDE